MNIHIINKIEKTNYDKRHRKRRTALFNFGRL